MIFIRVRSVCVYCPLVPSASNKAEVKHPIIHAGAQPIRKSQKLGHTTAMKECVWQQCYVRTRAHNISKSDFLATKKLLFVVQV